MEYSELVFRGEYLAAERERVKKDALIAASFTTWQTLGLHMEKPPEWRKYLTSLGLAEEDRATKEDLEREASAALKKAAEVIKKAAAAEAAGVNFARGII